MSFGHSVYEPADEPEAPEAYLPMVEALARRLARRLPAHIEIDDLISAGVVGLMEALSRYDRNHNVAFRPYAHTRVRGAMLDELRRRDLMARDARTLTKRLAQATGDLRGQLGRSPEDEELAAYLSLDVATLRDWLLKIAPVAHVSLDDPEGHSLTSDTHTALDAVTEQQMRAHLVKNIACLPQRTQDILHLYYTVELTLSDVGQVVGISESRVSQIITRATLELQAMMAESETRAHRGRINVGGSS